MKYLYILMTIIFVGCTSGTYEDDDNYFDTNVKDEPLFYQQWAIDYNETFYNKFDINQDANIHLNKNLGKYSGKGVKIAIIDNGLDMKHEDITIYKSYSMIRENYDVNPYNSDDKHGTAVTGIIGARKNGKGILGISYNSDIIFIQMKNSMTESEMIEMFEKAKEFGADIINCSWGTYSAPDALKDEIKDLTTNGRDGKGIIIVFAVGNDDESLDDSDIDDESEIEGVIGVASSNSDNLRADYSNYGNGVDVIAPGGYWYGITTTDIMGIDGYSTNNYVEFDDNNAFVGTSAGAPVVSGIIGLMLEKEPYLTLNEIMEIIKNRSDKIGNYNYENGRNNYYGYGKVNVDNYLQ